MVTKGYSWVGGQSLAVRTLRRRLSGFVGNGGFKLNLQRGVKFIQD